MSLTPGPSPQESGGRLGVVIEVNTISALSAENLIPLQEIFIR